MSDEWEFTMDALSGLLWIGFGLMAAAAYLMFFAPLPYSMMGDVVGALGFGVLGTTMFVEMMVRRIPDDSNSYYNTDDRLDEIEDRIEKLTDRIENLKDGGVKGT